MFKTHTTQTPFREKKLKMDDGWMPNAIHTHFSQSGTSTAIKIPYSTGHFACQQELEYNYK